MNKYKYIHLPEDATDFEKVVRYNYSRQDRIALVEVIAAIKSLEKALSVLSLRESIQRCIHFRVQIFLKETLLSMIEQLRKKRKKDILKNVENVFDLIIDNKESHARNCSPNETQLYILSSILGGLVHDSSPLMKGGVMKSKLFDSGQVSTVKKFLLQCKDFHYLINYEDTLKNCADLSQLWFKEFYLELSRGSQFPIETSLPWILTETALTEPSLIEYCLYPLELYNDSANHALHTLRSAFLFEEIRAEVDLVFDQLVFKVSQHIFAFYKAQASAIMLRRFVDSSEQDKKIAKMRKKLQAKPSRCATLMKQRQVQLLGETMNFAHLLAQSLNMLLRTNIDYMIEKFESSDVTGIVELDSLIENCKLTHTLLSEILDLDSFENVMQERNRSMKPGYTRIEQRIIYEMLYDFTPNFCFSSERNAFKRTPLSFSDEKVERHSTPNMAAHMLFGNKHYSQAFNAIYESHKDKFSQSHASCIVRIIGPGRLATLVDELICNAIATLDYILAPYIESLLSGMPNTLKLPVYSYTNKGIYELFMASLKDIISYPDLNTEVFQGFRVFGNTVLVIKMLDEALNVEEAITGLQARYFIKMNPPKRLVRLTQDMLSGGQKLGLSIQGGGNSPIICSRVVGDSVAERLGLRPMDRIISVNHHQFQDISHESATRILQTNINADIIVCSTVPITFVETFCGEISMINQRTGSKDFDTRARDAAKVAEGVSKSGSLLKGSLISLNKRLDKFRSNWLGPIPSNDIVTVDNNTEFYKLWSAIQFYYCTPPAKGNTYTSDILFGEGLQWGGLTIVYLLAQSKRFEALDFATHIVKAHRASHSNKCSTDERVGNVSLKEFVSRTERYLDLNTQIFQILRRSMPNAESPWLDNGTSCGVCKPPTIDTPPIYISFKGEHGERSRTKK